MCNLGLNFASYLPKSLTPAFHYIRSFTSAILGENPPPTDSAKVSRLGQSLSDAEARLREAEERLRNVQQEFEDLYNPGVFGKHGEWKKLDKLCLEKDTGEYVLSTTPGIQLFTFP
jgi:protein kinase C substrate 80K-H